MLLDESQLDRFTDMLNNNKRYFRVQPAKMKIGVVTSRTTGKYILGTAHEKFMITDSKKAFTGSYNFTWSAANINRELAIITTNDKDFLVQLLMQWGKMAQTKKPYWWPN